jgi:hypothetical protein
MKNVRDEHWLETSKHLDVKEAQAILRRLGEVHRQHGRTVKKVVVTRSEEAGDFSDRYPGNSLSIRCAG